jgi:hypothetical protein
MTHRHSDQLKGDVADGDIDSVQDGKGSKNEVLLLREASGDL